MCAASALCRMLHCHPSLLGAVAGRPDLMQQVRTAGAHNLLVSHSHSENQGHTSRIMPAEVWRAVLLR